jgi:hypothetical protein
VPLVEVDPALRTMVGEETVGPAGLSVTYAKGCSTPSTR